MKFTKKNENLQKKCVVQYKEMRFDNRIHCVFVSIYIGCNQDISCDYINLVGVYVIKRIACMHFMIYFAWVTVLRRYESYEFEDKLGWILNSMEVLIA